MRARGMGIALVVLGAACAVDCRTATDITVVVTTEVGCADLKGTSITVGKLREIETKPATSTSVYCDANGFVGALVVVPSGSRDDQVAIKVVSGVTTAADACTAPAYAGCIVARRALKYIPHAGLRVPITTRLDCKNVPCGELETCAHGVCVPATVRDSSACASAKGCGDDSLAASACGDMSGYAKGAAAPTVAYCGARTGRSPFVGPRTTPRESWEIVVSAAKFSPTPPVVSANGAVFTASSDNALGVLRAIDAATGVERWSFPTGSSSAFGASLGASGTLYFGSLFLHALDAETGTPRWTFKNTSSNVPWSPLLGPDETVYFSDDSGEIYAVAPTDGALRWRYKMGGLVGQLAIGANTVFAGNRNSQFVALDASSGALVWQTTLPNLYDSKPVLDESGVLYIGSQNGLVDALDARTGAKRWEAPAGAGNTCVALGAGDVLYVVAWQSVANAQQPGVLFALSRSTGATLWQTDLATRDAGCPLIDAAETVYVPLFNRVAAFDGTNGAKLWQFHSPSWSVPSLGQDGTLFVPGLDDKIYALKDGAAIGSSPQGAMCSTDGECATGHCVVGVCCETACKGACADCTTPMRGVCNAPSGRPGTPACAPYVCIGGHAACPGGCSSVTECVQGLTCVASKCQ